MTVINPPLAVQARADHAADDLRGALQVGVTPAGGTMLPRAGIIPGWGDELTPRQRAAGASMSVDVGSGACLLAAPTAGHGGWPLLNDGVVNLTIAAAHATLPRTDLVIARVADAQYYTGGDGAAAIKVITGVAAASPVAPTVPVDDGAYIVLGQVAVAAAAASITNAAITLNTSASRPYSVALGGILPVANAAARTALTAYLGMHVIEADTTREYVWDGAAWRVAGNPGDWTPYLPTVRANANGVAVFNGSRYSLIGKTMHVAGDVTINGSVVNGSVAASLPFQMRASHGRQVVGVGHFASGGIEYPLIAHWATVADIAFRRTDTRAALESPLSAGAVLTWAVTVEIA